jgi:hypothetical protein
MRILNPVCFAVLMVLAICSGGVTALTAVNFVGVPSGGADGDYNGDGIVDAADYTVWRDNLGGTTPLDNDGGLGTPITMDHYTLWSSQFGSVAGSGNTFAFEDPAIWTVTQYDPVPAAGLESTPPGVDSIWFAEDNAEDIVIVLNDERSGQNGSERMGTFSYGGETGANDFNSKITLVLNNSVTLTGIERDGDIGGEPTAAGARALRLGREDINPIGSAQGGTTETAPWGILLHRAGTLQYDPVDVPAGSARMDFSRDKPQSAGALYEISGDAVLNMAGAIRFGDRDNGGVRTTPGSIFRVRGSTPTVQVDDFIHESRLGLWDHDNDHQPTGVTRMNLGKFVAEFVLDENGVAPIEVTDELRLGRTETLDGNVEVGYAFLRLKLSEPTDAGSGELGSGDELVLFRFGRLTSLIDLGDPDSEIQMGRFFDPDREGLNSSGTTMLPHAGLWDNGTVQADYAGATYEWTINYFEGPTAPDPALDNTVVLSNLTITGTPGDLDRNGVLQAADRMLLVDTIASPPAIAIASAQNLFDLNADDLVDNLDLAVFDAHFAAGAQAVAVPEPESAALFSLAAMLIAIWRRRMSIRAAAAVDRSRIVD